MHLFYNFTAIIKFMIVIHLQRLGAQRSVLCFLILKKLNLENHNIFAIVCGFVIFFGNRWKIIFGGTLRCWQLNSIQNDVCFNHLGPKLWEKIHFLQAKVNFSGEGKNISKHINMTYV